MFLLRVYSLLKIVILLGSIATGEESTEISTTEIYITELPNIGVSYELEQEPLDNLKHKFEELFDYVKELGATVRNNQLKTDQLIQSHHEAIAANVSLMTTYAKQILERQASCEKPKPIESNETKPFKSCRDAKSKASGLYELVLPDNATSTTVFCDMISNGGGWLVFQQRVNGSVDFYRNWTEYRNGFGVVGEEFWAGLELLHKLTSHGSYELMIEVKDTSGKKTYARYLEFEIGSEEEKYSLKKLGRFKGTATDAFSYHSGMNFSTFDSDNDVGGGNCAEFFGGAWWYKSCFHSNLNGRFGSMCWGAVCTFKPMDTRMMIRLK